MKLLGFFLQGVRSLLALFGFGAGNCLYYPTCTNVIAESFEKNGLLKTTPVIFQRIIICNPIYKKFGKIWQY
tara:strand:+ start:447 stop:662 length:216 start_codon:yes stop_codon:yes gene_type:complete